MAKVTPRTALITGQTVTPDIVTNDGIWSVKVDATAGQFKLTIDGTQTADIAYNAAASAVKTALVATDKVQTDDVTVTGGPGSSGGGTPYVVTVADVIEPQTDVPTLTGQTGTTPLSGGGAAITVTTTQAPTVRAAHQTTVITDPNAGNAVQTPIAQQTGTVGNANQASPKTTLSL
jgi:hypothetical protein